MIKFKENGKDIFIKKEFVTCIRQATNNIGTVIYVVNNVFMVDELIEEVARKLEVE